MYEEGLYCDWTVILEKEFVVQFCIKDYQSQWNAEVWVKLGAAPDTRAIAVKNSYVFIKTNFFLLRNGGKFQSKLMGKEIYWT